MRIRFGESSFSSCTQYVCALYIERQNKPLQICIVTRAFQANGPIRAVEIVKALTAATNSGDLADAFAWFEDRFPSDSQQVHAYLQIFRSRAESLHGCSSQQGSIPLPNRALHNEVAYMMMSTLNIVFDIRLIGLRGATHLNGREGVIRGQDPANLDLWTARLDDGTCVSVKAANFMHLHREDYRRKLP
jgi:hypothetical protein